MVPVGPWNDEDGRWCCGFNCGRPCPYGVKLKEGTTVSTASKDAIPGISSLGFGQPPQQPEPAPGDSDMAFMFLRNFGIEPTADAVNQLVKVFLPCLQIMSERGYDPEGATWRAAGWRPQLYEMMKKMARIKFHGWNRQNRPPVLSEIPDLINYAGFLQRGLEEDIKPWGEWGDPA